MDIALHIPYWVILGVEVIGGITLACLAILGVMFILFAHGLSKGNGFF